MKKYKKTIINIFKEQELIETNNVQNLHVDGVKQKVPFYNMAEPQEVANVALFLASNEASYVSGVIFAVDGAAGLYKRLSSR